MDCFLRVTMTFSVLGDCDAVCRDPGTGGLRAISRVTGLVTAPGAQWSAVGTSGHK